MSTPPKILRLKQLQNMVGLSRSSIYDAMKKSNFPRQVKLTGGRSVGWVESDVQDFIQSRIDASRNQEKGN